MLTQLFIGCVQRLLGSVISIQSQFVEQIHAVRALKIPTMAIDLAELERTSEHRHERGGVIEKPLRGIASGEHTEITHPIVVIGAVDHIERVADPALTTECSVITEALRPQCPMQLKVTQVTHTLAITILCRAALAAQIAKQIAANARPLGKHEVVGQG